MQMVDYERTLQDSKWGVQNHDWKTWYAILGEEFGETGRAINECDGPEYLAEIVQVAAVAVAMIESYVRNDR